MWPCVVSLYWKFINTIDLFLLYGKFFIDLIFRTCRGNMLMGFKSFGDVLYTHANSQATLYSVPKFQLSQKHYWENKCISHYSYVDFWFLITIAWRLHSSFLQSNPDYFQFQTQIVLKSSSLYFSTIEFHHLATDFCSAVVD